MQMERIDKWYRSHFHRGISHKSQYNLSDFIDLIDITLS